MLEPAQLDELDSECAEFIKKCVSEAKAAPMPTAAQLMTDVYVSY